MFNFFLKLSYAILIMIGIRLILQLFFNLDKIVFIKNLIVFVIILTSIGVINKIKNKHD
jgi:hypothetical protein